MSGPANQTTGLDGYTEDDVPMMTVGPPSLPDPNQLTSKPRQMPSGGAPAPGTFDPAAMGLDVGLQRAEDNDTGTDREDGAGDTQSPEGASDTGQDFPTQQAVASLSQIAAKVLTDNPGLTPREAVDLSEDVFIFMGAWESVSDGAWTRKIDHLPVGEVYDHRPYTDQARQWAVQKTKDFAGAAFDKVKDQARSQVSQWWQKHRPAPTVEHDEFSGQPLPDHYRQPQGGPAEDDWSAEPPAPEPPRPRTVGDHVQDQFAANPGNREIRRDLWKDRFSDQPLHPPSPREDEW